MSLPKRDIIATILVGAAAILYVLWAAEAAPAGLRSVRATGIAILGLGFAASASAVVPSFDALMHGNKVYVTVTSVLGLVAFGAGLWMLVSSSGTALGVVMAAMVALWAIATVHHVRLAKVGSSIQRLRPGPPGVATH